MSVVLIMHQPVGIGKVTESMIDKLVRTYDAIQVAVSSVTGEGTGNVNIQRSELDAGDRVHEDVVMEIFIEDPTGEADAQSLSQQIREGLVGTLPLAEYAMRVIPENSHTYRFYPGNILGDTTASQ